MTTKFHGFLAGTAVSLLTAGITVPAWGAEAEASAAVAITEPTDQLAPNPVTFEITDFEGFDTLKGDIPNYDARHHLIEAFWDFGDPGSTFTAPQNILPQHRNANIGYGSRAAHVYKTAGVYTWSVLLFEGSSGKTKTISGTVTVKSKSAAITGAQVSIVDPDGDYSGTGITGARTYTSLRDAILGTAGRGPTRILLRRGKTYDFGTSVLLRATHPSIFIEAFGTGSRPIIRSTHTNTYPMLRIVHDYGGARFVTDGIHFQGPWNAATERGLTQNAVDCENGADYLFTNCVVDGWKQGIASIQSPGSDPYIALQRFTMHDTVVTNWQDYGCWASQSIQFQFLGNRIAQKVDGRSGGNKFQGHTQHGCIRFQPPQGPKAVIHGCDFFTRNGWFPNVPGYRTEQPCIRWNMGQKHGSFLSLQCCALEGGFPLVAIGRMNGSLPIVTNSSLIERNVLVGSHSSPVLLTNVSTGFTVRTNLMIHVNIKRINSIYDPTNFVSTEWIRGIDGGDPNQTYPEAYVAPTRIAGNTCINLMADASYASSNSRAAAVKVMNLRNFPDAATEAAINLIEENNLVHEPNRGTPFVTYAPLDATPLWAPRHIGYISSDTGILQPELATPADSVWNGAPKTGSTAIGGATGGATALGRMGRTTLTGAVRPAAKSRGAREPAA